MYKTGEKSVREKEEDRKIMQKIERDAEAAHAAHASGSSGALGASSTVSPTSGEEEISIATAKTKTILEPPKPIDKYANYSSAASLGYIDHEEIERQRLQQLAKEKEQQGVASSWETVAVIEPDRESLKGEGHENEHEHDSDTYGLHAESGRPSGTRDRTILQGSLDHDPNEEARSFDFNSHQSSTGTTKGKSKRFNMARYDDFQDDFDPESIMKKVKVKEESLREKEEKERKQKQKEMEENKPTIPKRLEGGLNRSGWKGMVIGSDGTKFVKQETEEVKTETETQVEEEEEVKTEAEPGLKAEVELEIDTKTPVNPSPASDPTAETKPVVAQGGGGGMFKKRKAPAGANRSVRQRM